VSSQLSPGLREAAVPQRCFLLCTRGRGGAGENLYLPGGGFQGCVLLEDLSGSSLRLCLIPHTCKLEFFSVLQALTEQLHLPTQTG